MAKMTPIVQRGTLVYQQNEDEQVLVVGTPTWYAWLETASTFAFTSDAGTFMARKERVGNQRGGWYWKAYCTHQGKLASRYLGKSETLSLERLHPVAQALTSLSVPDREVVRPATHPQHDPLLATKLHVPPQMHLIIVTCADPPLPPSRLRAHGQLTELRAAELRFRDAEADAFLSECQEKSLAEAERFLIV